MSRRFATICLVAIGCFAASGLPAKDKQTTPEPPLRTGQAAIEKALQEPVDLKFVETPLSDVIAFLKKRANIEIVLDEKTLAEVGLTKDTPVTIELSALPLRSALNLMLRRFYLTWLIENDVLLITTFEEEDSLLTTKVIDVADLVVCKNTKGELWDDYDSLIDAITTTILPTTWDQVGGPGSIVPANFGTAKAIVVSQTYTAHCRVAELLEGIRAIAKKNPDAGPPRRDPPKTDADENHSPYVLGSF